MDTDSQDSISKALTNIREGDEASLSQLMATVYDELRALAHRRLQQERPGHTLQSTALAHEVYLKLVDRDDIDWRDRARFFAVAAQSIRRILIDHARGKKRLKRGGGYERIPLDATIIANTTEEVDVEALDEALNELAQLNERQAQIVEQRFFGGLTNREVAEVLGVSLRTVEGEWAMARAWLRERLRDQGDSDDT